MIVHVLKYQSLFDIAVQETGNMENAYRIAEANNMTLSDDLTTDTLYIPDDLIIEQKKVDALRYKNIRPATAISLTEQSDNPYGGIGYMQIQTDFIVS